MRPERSFLNEGTILSNKQMIGLRSGSGGVGNGSDQVLIIELGLESFQSHTKQTLIFIYKSSM
jgi:hypothetical protein